jgi:hypothetical protein
MFLPFCYCFAQILAYENILTRIMNHMLSPRDYNSYGSKFVTARKVDGLNCDPYIHLFESLLHPTIL